MSRAVAVVLRSAPSIRPSLQSRHQMSAEVCKCLKAMVFSGLTRPSLQSTSFADFWCVVSPGCALHRPGEPRDIGASNRRDADSMLSRISPGSRDSRHQFASAAVAIGGGVRADTRRQSNSVAQEFVGGVERGCRMLRTAAEFDSLQAPGKVAARGWQGNVALRLLNPNWKARTSAAYSSIGREPQQIESDVCTYINEIVPGASDFATGRELLCPMRKSRGLAARCLASA